MPPTRLELEVTQATLFTVESERVPARLHTYGIRIALDDFGTGFFSRSHLFHFNLDGIKIDRSFVGLLGNKTKGVAIVSAIMSLSRTLGKAATAEGMETSSQRDFLIAIGCDELPGCLFSGPIPADSFYTALCST